MGSDQIRKPDPAPALDNVDLCDVWLDVGDHRCQSYWREEVVLTEPVKLSGCASMYGTYSQGTWRFCRMHARMFHKYKEK